MFVGQVCIHLGRIKKGLNALFGKVDNWSAEGRDLDANDLGCIGGVEYTGNVQIPLRTL